MIEEIRKNIYRIAVPLPGNPLKLLNSYFIRGSENDVLIDTGFRMPECREALQAGLDELGSDSSRRDVLVTHFHADHIGMADYFAGEGRHIYINPDELECERLWVSGEAVRKSHRGFLEAGMAEDVLNIIDKNNPASVYNLQKLTDNFKILESDETVQVGDYELKPVIVPGHTPYNSMFWLESEKIMFTGDHVLFDITPNITSWGCYDIKDSLGDYLKSLDIAEKYPVELALPGHRMTGDYHARIRALKEHHKRRLEDSYNIIKSHPGLNGQEIAGMMQWQIRAKNWEEFPIIQKWFAVGEAQAHIDYLLLHGEIKREMVDGIWKYRV